MSLVSDVFRFEEFEFDEFVEAVGFWGLGQWFSPGGLSDFRFLLLVLISPNNPKP